jgi:hypothetical protein
MASDGAVGATANGQPTGSGGAPVLHELQLSVGGLWITRWIRALAISTQTIVVELRFALICNTARSLECSPDALGPDRVPGISLQVTKTATGASVA